MPVFPTDDPIDYKTNTDFITGTIISFHFILRVLTMFLQINIYYVEVVTRKNEH